MSVYHSSTRVRRASASLWKSAITLTGAIALGAALVAGAQAQSWPERAVTLVVPYPAGGATDASARRVSEFLSKELGQPVVIENKSGANSVVGSTYVAQSKPDGYTFLYTTLVAQAGNVFAYESLPYDTLEGFVEVTAIQAPPNVLVAHPSVEAETFGELLALARKRPGEITFGTNGPGSPAGLRGQQMMNLGDIEFSLIAYKGGKAALADLVGGHVNLYPAQLPTIMSFKEEGQLKVLAALGKERLDSMPDVPSITETPGFEGFQELATFPLIAAPVGTPEERVAKMQKAVEAVIKNEGYLKLSRAARDYPPFAASPEEADRMLRDYIDLMKELNGAQGASN